MRGLRLAPMLVAAGIAAGCGTPPADLFVITRSGSVPGARLKLLVTDGGFARCNSGAERPVGSARLIEARDVARELEGEAARGVRLPPGPGAVLTYRVRLEGGSIRFSDTSARQPPEFRRLQALTRRLATDVCGLKR